MSHDPTTFDVVTTRLLGRTLLRPFWRGWVRRLQLQRGERVLDFGSGSGQLSRRLALAVGPTGKVSCLDVSSRWLEVAREEAGDLAWVDFHLGDLDSLPPSAYDVVHLHYVLHDIPPAYRGAVCTALRERLRPGGRLVLREPLYYLMLDTEELLALTKRVGFEQPARPRRRWWLAGPVIEIFLRRPV